MDRTVAIRADYAGIQRIARSIGALMLLGCLCTSSSGCIDPEQNRVVLSWYDACDDADKLQDRAPATLLSVGEAGGES